MSRPAGIARRLAGWCLAAWMAGGCGQPAPDATVEVFAAASLAEAVTELAQAFEAAHPSYRVAVHSAATSLLARQVRAGAPVDVFFSADTAWMAVLAADGLLADRARTPVGNRLVLVRPPGSDPSDAFAEAVRVRRLALADPSHVPAGRYAAQGLRCLGLWEPLQPALVSTLDVRAALWAVRHGAAEAAVVYATDLAVTPEEEVVTEWPARCAPTVRFPIAVLAGAAPAEGAQAFVRFAAAPEQASFWARRGFVSCHQTETPTC